MILSIIHSQKVNELQHLLTGTDLFLLIRLEANGLSLAPGGAAFQSRPLDNPGGLADFANWILPHFGLYHN